MKKTIFSLTFTILLLLTGACNVLAMTDAELDLYNHQYYPQSVNNGGINQSLQESTHDFDVNPATGSAVVRVNDVTLPGKNGFDLAITRTYNSFQSNLYEPYVKVEDASISTTCYMVTTLKSYKEKAIDNKVTEETNILKGINKHYYDYTTGTEKYYNMSIFEFETNDYEISDLFDDYDEAAALAQILNNTEDDIFSSYPSASVGEYTANYDNAMVVELIVDVPTKVYETEVLADTSLERYSRLGAGWEFDFPYVEKRYGNDDYEYLHYGNKGTWKIDVSSNNTNGLAGYPLNDIMVAYDSSVLHDGNRSQYCVTEKNGKKSYFGNDGRLLIQRDRFGNEIKFYHDFEFYTDTNGRNQKYPFLTGITDSVGRTVSISYGNDFTYLGAPHKDVTLTITDPTDADNTLVYTYRLRRYNDVTMNEDMPEYALARVIQPDKKNVLYGYSILEAPVDFFDRNLEFAYEYSGYKKETIGNSYITKDMVEELSGADNYYALLSSVSESDGRSRMFNYSRFLKNCTPTGSMLFYKAYYMSDDLRFDENDIQYETNEHNYRYFINNDTEYDGYPYYRRSDRIGASFRIVSKDIFGDVTGPSDKLVTNTYTYRYVGEGDSQTILLDNSVSDSVDAKTTVNYTYDSETNLITNSLTRSYDSPTATEYMQSDEAYTYDSGNFGDIISMTPNSDGNRTVSYEYNSVYHYPTKRTYKRNAETTIVEEYLPASDNLSVQYEKVYENGALKRTVEYARDSYGNITQKKEYLNETDFIRTDYSYTDTQYGGQFTGSNLMSETVYDVSNPDNTAVNVSVSYQYDWRGNPIKVTDGNGNQTAYEYDSMSRVVKVTAPDGSVETTDYTIDSYGIEITRTDALGNEVVDVYDGSENLLASYLDGTSIKTKECFYDGYNNLIKEIRCSTNDNNGTVLYTYDTLQRPLTKKVYNNGGELVYEETYSYEITPDYRKETVTVVGGTDNPSVVTSVYYDIYGNKIKTQIGNDYETYTYDYAGNITSVKSARANSEGWTQARETEYDFMGNVITQTDELGNVTRAEYDPLGRLVKAYDVNGYATEYTYDNLGRVTEQKTPFEEKDGIVYYSAKQMWYDKNGNTVKERVDTNAAGEAAQYSEATYTYDNRNRLIMTETSDGTTPNYVQNYYDAKGNLLRVYTGLHAPLTIHGPDDVTVGADTEYAVTKYAYDNVGRLTSVTDALGNTETNTYDLANGLLLSSTDRNGNVFSYSYDALGKLTAKSLADGTNGETVSYGSTGQVLSRQNDTVTLRYAYNEKGQLVSEIDPIVGAIKTYTYDAGGNRLTMTLVRNGAQEFVQSYGYDKLNRLVSVSLDDMVIASYSYDNNGNRTQTVLRNGDTTSYTYNLANLITSQTTGSHLSEAYTYYLSGNQKSKVTNGVTTNYTYDSMNRLVSENNTQFTFDDFGNRLTMSDGETTTTYSYDRNNRLTQTNAVNGNVTTHTKYFYDPNGNQITKMVTVNQPEGQGEAGVQVNFNKTNHYLALLEYNCYNQMVSLDTNGVKTTYAYAPDGLRHSKTVDGIKTSFVYDNANIIEEITPEGATRYYRGLEIIRNDKVVCYYYNGQGDVAFLKDRRGNVLADYTFDAYGNSLQENTYYNPFGYRGEYTDAESGWVYLRARMYDPAIGRFVNEDPIRDGLNWYVYCENNPVMFVDPTGLALKMSLKDYEENFLPQARQIYGNPNLEFNYQLDGSYVVINEWTDIDFDGGSDIGRALMKAVITHARKIDVKYNNGGVRETSGYLSYADILHLDGWGNKTYTQAERNATLIHEFAHVYTAIKGYDVNVKNATNSIDIQRGYQEATAITVEQRYRQEMGYEDRSTQTTYMIDGNYGFWPHQLSYYPNGTVASTLVDVAPGKQSGVSLMQSVFIWYDIISQYGQ